MTTDTLKPSLLHILRQGELLLERLTDADYVRPVPQAFNSGVGGHYRHSLEHVEALLTPAAPDRIDYDARKRDPVVETDRARALAVTRDYLRLAERLTDTDLARPVTVRCGVTTDGASPEVDSTLAREVMYAVIHAVHHYAIIRMMCNVIDVDLPADFGVAPSTLQHRRATEATG